MKIPQTIRYYCLLAVILLFVGFIDWLTTAEVSVGPLYLFAVGYGAWYLGKTNGLIAGVICTAMWFIIDRGSGHRYTQNWIVWEQAGVRMFTYAMLTIFIALYRKTLEAHRQRLAMLEQVLAVCPGCGRIGPQEGGWQRAEDLHKLNRERYKFCPTCISTQKADGLAHPPRAEHP